MRLKQRALRGAMWSMLGGNAAQIISLAIFLVISGIVGPEAFGVVAVALSFLEISRAIIIDPLVGVLIAKKEGRKEDFDAGFWLSVCVSVILFGALNLAAPSIAQQFRMPELASAIPQLSWMVLISGVLRVQEAWLSHNMAFRALATRATISVTAGGVLGIVAALSGLGIEALIIQQLASAVMTCALTWLASPWRPRIRIERPRFVALLTQATTLTPAGLLGIMTAMLDGMAAGLSGGAAAAGVYGLAKRIRLALQMGFSNGLTRVALPVYARMEDDRARLARALEMSANLGMFAAFPVFVGVAAVAPELIALALNPRWEGAIGPLLPLAIGGCFAIATSFLDSALTVLGKRAWMVLLRLGALIVLIVLLALWAGRGLTAIAVSSLTASVTLNVFAFALVSRFVPLSALRQIQTIGAPLLLALLMYAALAFVREQGMLSGLPLVLQLVALMALGAAIYVGGAWLIARQALRQTIEAARTVLVRT